MTARRGTGRQLITVGRLLRREFLVMLATLRVHGYDVQAELISSGVFDCDYQLTVRGNEKQIRVVQEMLRKFGEL